MPGKLARLTGCSVATISIHLAKLRVADVVRYDTLGERGLLGALKKVIRVLMILILTFCEFSKAEASAVQFVRDPSRNSSIPRHRRGK